MLIKTRKFQMNKELYMRMAFTSIAKRQWWVILAYLLINCGTLLAPSWWWMIGSTILLVLYVLFWLVQIAGVTQHEQAKTLFEKVYYQITGQQLMLMMDAKRGMPLKWDMIEKVEVVKDKKTKKTNAFILWLPSISIKGFKLPSVQMIYLPARIFTSDAQLNFMEHLLKRKGYITE